MNNFPEFDNESMGGCESFRFIPCKHTQSEAIPTDSVVTSLPVPKAGKAILDGLAVMRTLSFVENEDTVNAGDFYKTVIKGFVPKLDSAYLALFNEMRRYRHIVICKDNNGVERVCGTIAHGMIFSFNQDTKDAPAGANGFSFQFSEQFTEPSPMLVLS